MVKFVDRREVIRSEDEPLQSLFVHYLCIRMTRRKEGLVFDNAFTRERQFLPSFLGSDGPGMMSRALTFDERSLLRFDRKKSGGDKFPKKGGLLNRASTMVWVICTSLGCFITYVYVLLIIVFIR